MASPWTADSGTVTADSPYYLADGSYVVPGPPPPLATVPTGAPVQTSLQNTINAYLYQDFAGDDNLQAFIDAYNGLSQYYLNWFNANPLTFYPGLSGAQLDWIAAGVYGLKRTSLASPINPPVGPLNTAELNTIEFNSWSPPTQTFYAISDDVFQRIITWHFFKGDGLRFNLRWLKRRVMRFILGANGLDPSPWYPNAWPGVGVENTQAVGVSISGSTITVTINGAAISSITQLAPGILQYFQLAFQSGVLQMPAQFTTLVCNIVWTLTATATPSIDSIAGIATTLTTGNAIVTAIGGNGQYTYSWTWQSGGSGITINSPSSNVASFTASGMARGSTRSGVALCTVMDSASHSTTAVVSVTIQNVSAPSLSLSPTSLSNTGANSVELTSVVTASVSGGAGPYTYSWTWQSGGSGITIESPSSASTWFQATNLSPGQTVSGTALCTVIDAYGQQATATCNVTLSRVTQVSASCSPTSESASNTTQPITTGATTVTASGGGGSYTYRWTWQSGGGSISINSPNSSSTNFTGSGLSPNQTATGTALCTVTDQYGQTATTTCSVSITYNPPAPITRIYTSGSGTETVPAVYNAVVIEIISGGGGGEGGFFQSSGHQSYGGQGGDSGTYSRSLYTCSSGQTLSYVVGGGGTRGAGGNYGAPGAGGTSSVSSGSLSITTMTAPGGNTGLTSSGGNQANSGPNHGTAGSLNTVGTGGSAISGEYVGAYGAGGNGGLGVEAGSPGGEGVVAFHYYYVG